jgi:hypothetical protein
MIFLWLNFYALLQIFLGLALCPTPRGIAQSFGFAEKPFRRSEWQRLKPTN